MSADRFEAFDATLSTEGTEAALAALCEQLRQDKKYHELFDARLMQCRQRLGLPCSSDAKLDDLPENLRDDIEEGYVQACSEVGRMLLAAGELRQAWMYLRPAGEEQRMHEAIKTIEASEETIEEIIAIALHEGVNPEFGFSLVLSHYGTCNAITTYDSAMYNQPRPIQQAAVAQLARALHTELVENVRVDLYGNEAGEVPDSAPTTLKALVAGKQDQFTEYTSHVDVSHLGSIVRMARIVEDPEVLRLVLDLTEYGRVLHEHFQPAGDDPFLDPYRSHGLFFAAQLGEQVDESLDHFRQRSEASNVYEEGSGPAEVYIALLARLHRYAEAIRVTNEKLPHGTPSTGFAPSLLELSRQLGDYSAITAACRSRDDLLGFAVSRLEEVAIDKPADSK